MGADEKPVILVVDDENSFRSKVGEFLRRRGYAVLEAGTGGEATRLAREYADDLELILLDIVLPDVSGGAVATEVLSRDAREPKVLYMSGYERDELVDAGLIRPHDRLLSKPFELPELATAVARALEAEDAPEG